jgi:uncharacterized membrane protein YjgN (DUF898 family)
LLPRPFQLMAHRVVSLLRSNGVAFGVKRTVNSGGSENWILKMRRRVLTVLGVLLIATLTIQTATAAARNARKSVRAAVPVTQQPREGLSAPAAVHSRSCDRFWCYEDGAPVSASRK